MCIALSHKKKIILIISRMIIHGERISMMYEDTIGGPRSEVLHETAEV